MSISNIDLSNIDTQPLYKREIRNQLNLIQSLLPVKDVAFYGPDDDTDLKLLPSGRDEEAHWPAKIQGAELSSGWEPCPQLHETPDPFPGYTIFLHGLQAEGDQIGAIAAAVESAEHPFETQEPETRMILNTLEASAQTVLLMEKFRRLNDQLTVMLDINTHLNVAATKNDFLYEISRFGRYFLQFDRAVLVLHPEETPEYFMIDSIEGEESDLQRGMTYPVYRSLVGRTIITGQHQIYRKGKDEEPGGIYRAGDLEDYPFAQTIAFPLGPVKNGPGVLLLESRRTYKLGADELNIFNMISQSLGAALSRFSLYERLNNYATIDTLTHLYNLRALKQRFEEELARAGRYQSNMAILFLDLDKFKRVNDTYGHLMGDYVLRETSRLIKESVRTADVVGRYGGEEFVVLMVNSTAEACVASAERICRVIREFRFEMNDVVLQSKISIGVSEYPRDGEKMEDLIRAADTAMYNAKADGGDQVVIYQTGLVARSREG